MQLNKLAVGLIGVLVASFASQANASPLSRAFNNGATSVDLYATVAPTFRQSKQRLTYLGSSPRAFDKWTRTSGGWRQTAVGSVADVLATQDLAQTDERLRMSGVSDSSVGAYVRQNLGRKTTLTTALGIGNYVGGGSFWTGDIELAKENLGSLTFTAAAQLPSSATSGTYNQTDRYAGSAVIAEYERIPNVTLTGYYAFADDNYELARGLKESYGAKATYTHSFAARNNLTTNIGYSKGQRDDDLSVNSVARDREAAMLGLSYNYYDWTLGVDGGTAKANYHGNIIDSTKTNSVGARLTYAFSPRVSAYGFYGKQDTKSTEATGTTLNFQTLLNNSALAGKRAIDERQLFKTIKEDTYGIGMRYTHTDNLSFTGSVSQSNRKFGLTDGEFAKLKSDTYSLGMTFSF